MYTNNPKKETRENDIYGSINRINSAFRISQHILEVFQDKMSDLPHILQSFISYLLTSSFGKLLHLLRLFILHPTLVYHHTIGCLY